MRSGPVDDEEEKMRALTWQGPRNVSGRGCARPPIQDRRDVIIRITSTAICGSDLHLLDVLGPFLHKGDVLGHEPMGVVVEVGSDVREPAVGDRVVIPFVIACGDCFMCRRGLTTQCETTQNRDQRHRRLPLRLHRAVRPGARRPGRVPARAAADFNAMKVATDLPDERYLFLSDILPTAWQGVRVRECARRRHARSSWGSVRSGSSPRRIGKYLGYRVIGVDPVPERRAMAERHGVETLDLTDDVLEQSSAT